MKLLNQHAASQLFQQNNSLLDPTSIDLHGLTYNEAKQKLVEVIGGWNCRDRGRVKIITGAGNHSSNGVGRLAVSMPGVVRQMGWKVESGGNGWFYAYPNTQ